MDLGLQGKVVVIAGGAAGIGRECAEAFAAEGARLAIFDWDADALAETASAIGATGSEVHTERVDVSDARSVDAAHARVIESLGGIDVGFNNAGIITPSKAIEDTSEDDWDRVVGVNLKGVWLCVRAQVRHMRPRGAGAIVNMASAAALAAEGARVVICGRDRARLDEAVARIVASDGKDPQRTVALAETVHFRASITGGDVVTVETLELPATPEGRLFTHRLLVNAKVCATATLLRTFA